MAYQVYCDGYLMHDARDEENYMLIDPVVTVAANACGEMEFHILRSHQHYGKMRTMRSIFTVVQDNAVIFRGRMTNESIDFDNISTIHVEGILACLNDTIVAPFDAAKLSGANKVEAFLKHVIEQHNEQTSDWQQLQLGNVTVTDENGALNGKTDGDMTAWEAIKTRLFESALGGFLLVRYAADGTYVDYMPEFTQVSSQRIMFGNNLLDMVRESDSSETYTAMKPRGAKSITISSLTDGDLDGGLRKKGAFVYSVDGVAKYGWRCAPVQDSRFDKVTSKTALRNQAAKYLREQSSLLNNSITVQAVDLHFTDAQIASFRVGTSIITDAPAHGIVNQAYPLTQMEIHLDAPQDTKITLNSTRRTMSGYGNSADSVIAEQIAGITEEVNSAVSDYMTSTELTEHAAADASLSSGTSYVSLKASVTLQPGTYIIIGVARFGSGSGRRGLVLNVGGETLASSGVIAPGTSNGATRLQTVSVVRLDAETAVALYGFQNSGSSIDVDNKVIRCFKLA